MVTSSFEVPSEAGPFHGSLQNPDAGVEAELARYLPHLDKMGTQLRQTSTQIEESVVGVCRNFQAIAERARATVARATGFLGRAGDAAEGKRSFDSL